MANSKVLPGNTLDPTVAVHTKAPASSPNTASVARARTAILPPTTTAELIGHDSLLSAFGDLQWAADEDLTGAATEPEAAAPTTAAAPSAPLAAPQVAPVLTPLTPLTPASAGELAPPSGRVIEPAAPAPTLTSGGLTIAAASGPSATADALPAPQASPPDEPSAHAPATFGPPPVADEIACPDDAVSPSGRADDEAAPLPTITVPTLGAAPAVRRNQPVALAALDAREDDRTAAPGTPELRAPATTAATPVVQPIVEPVHGAAVVTAATDATAVAGAPVAPGAARAAAPMAADLRLGAGTAGRTTGAAPPQKQAEPDDEREPAPTSKPTKPKPVKSMQRTIAAGPKRKRHPFRAFFKLVLVVAILGGGAYAGYWYKFLRNKVDWPADVKDSAAFVEKTLHRDFTEEIAVKTLAPADYETRLTGHALRGLYAEPTVGSDLGTGAANAAGVVIGQIPTSLALRAVGLVGADVPPSVGPILAANVTSFYDDHTIYRLDGTSALFQIDMLRSLAAALVDQEIDFSSHESTLTDAQRTGLRAKVDGVANDVVAAKYAELSALEASVQQEIDARVAALADRNVPVYLFAYLSSRAAGAHQYGLSAEDPIAGLTTPPNDAAVFDPGRALAATTTAAAPNRELGMEFWFDTLVPVLGPDAARTAALLWHGDSSRPAMGQGGPCVSSTISTADEAAEAALAGSMQQWAAARADVVVATATPLDTGSGVQVESCAVTSAPPIATAAAADMSAFFERAATERSMLVRAHGLGLPASAPTDGCAVAAFRNGADSGFDPTSDDPAMVAMLNDVIAFCKSATGG